MGFLRRIESRLEGVFEGGIGRTFRSHVQPVELARKLTKEMDDNKVISVQQVYVPNAYTVFLAPADREQFLAYEARLRTELAGYLTEHARREGYSLPGRARVIIETADELEVGTFGIAAEMEETPPPVAMESAPPADALPAEFGGGAAAPVAAEPPVAPEPLVAPIPPVAPIIDPFAVDSPDAFAPATPEPAVTAAVTPPAPAEPPAAAPTAVASWTLVWPGGEVTIGGNALVIGRSKDCDVPLADGNVSRRHAELGRSEEGFVLRDLDSTNGTLVNGRRIRSATIGAGDEITIGMSTLRIEQRHG
ncbi:MAG: DUF2662 domain-containing protein [Thermoleophilia bacterium]|nr:DUF2662 domain-containing protein [Thermoleophilia bacterium]